MYQAVGIFIGQGVERNIDVARSTVLMKSNKKDFVGDVLLQESCQWYSRRKGMGAQMLSETQHRVLGGGHIPKKKKNVPSKITTPPLSNLLSG